MRGHIEKRGKESYSIARDGVEQIRGVIQRGILEIVINRSLRREEKGG